MNYVINYLDVIEMNKKMASINNLNIKEEKGSSTLKAYDKEGAKLFEITGEDIFIKGLIASIVSIRETR